MIERINDYAARHFGGVGTSVASFIRIHVWAAVFLVGISLALPSREPSHPQTATPSVVTQTLTLPSNDSRAYAPSPFGEDRFRIAWIGGSEASPGAFAGDPSGVRAVPTAVASSLSGEINGRPIGVDFYMLLGMRVGDIYFSLLRALETRPDMIVISLNPAWVLNPTATHSGKHLDSGAAVRLLEEPNAWALAAGLLSPSDLMWGLADSGLTPLRDRAYYSEQIHQKIDTLGPLKLGGLSAALAAQVPTETERILATSPPLFWAQQRSGELPAPGPELWAQLLHRSNGGDNSLNKTFLRHIAQALRDSGIPSYVYLAPVNGDWISTSENLRREMTGIEQQLDELRPQFTAGHILFQPLNAIRSTSTLEFTDLVHLASAEPMGPYLAGEICRFMYQLRYRTVCPAGLGSESG